MTNVVICLTSMINSGLSPPALRTPTATAATGCRGGGVGAATVEVGFSYLRVAEVP